MYFNSGTIYKYIKNKTIMMIQAKEALYKSELNWATQFEIANKNITDVIYDKICDAVAHGNTSVEVTVTIPSDDIIADITKYLSYYGYHSTVQIMSFDNKNESNIQVNVYINWSA